MVLEEVCGRAWIWTKINLLQNPHPSQHTLLPEENKIRSESWNLAFESVTFSGKIRRAGIINTTPILALLPSLWASKQFLWASVSYCEMCEGWICMKSADFLGNSG